MRFLKAFIFAVFLTGSAGCSENKTNKEKVNMEVPKITKAVENIIPTADQQQRRANSEAVCKAKGIRIYENPSALFVNSEEETELRAQNEVVDRAVALLYTALKGEGLEQSK